jgi:hypothetical protein
LKPHNGLIVRLLLAAILGGLVLKAVVSGIEPKLVFFPYKGEDQNPASV